MLTVTVGCQAPCCIELSAPTPVLHLRKVVCITDPVLATQIMRSKHFDKIRFHYSFLDPMRSSYAPIRHSKMILLQQHAPPARLF